MKRSSRILTVVALLVLGCSVRFIAEHDPVVEANARQLHAKFDALFEDLARTAGTADGEYQHYAHRYEGLHADLSALRYRAGQKAGNEQTMQSLSLLDQNLQHLEAAHREGLRRGEVPVLRTLFDTQLRMIVQLETAKKRESASGGDR